MTRLRWAAGSLMVTLQQPLTADDQSHAPSRALAGLGYFPMCRNMNQ